MHQLADHNFRLHATRIPSLTKGMHLFKTKGLSFVDSGLNCDTFNIIHVHDSQEIEPGEIKESVGYFRKRNLEFCLWINDHNLTPDARNELKNAGLTRQASEVGMIIDLTNYQLVDHPLHSNIKMADTPEIVQDYAEVIARHWTPPDENVRSYYRSTADHYLNQENGATLLVYYHDGEPASTVELFATDHQTIGFYGFATLETYRRKGIGSAMFSFAMNRAKSQGFKYAILQATDDGIGIYKKAGFEEVTTFYEYA